MSLIEDMNAGMVREYYDGSVQTGSVDATIYVGKKNVGIDQKQFAREEVEQLLADIDAMARTRANQEIAVQLAEAFPAILLATRWAKVKGTQEYAGQDAQGRQLCATLLRGVHIGDSRITDSLAAGTTGMYGGTSAAVYSWLPASAWTAGTAKTWFPSQVMAEAAAIVFTGFIETEEIPKVDGYTFTTNGVATPYLPLKFNNQRRSANRDPSVAKLLKPVIFGPQTTVAAALKANKTGDSQPEPIAVLITMAQNLSL